MSDFKDEPVQLGGTYSIVGQYVGFNNEVEVFIEYDRPDLVGTNWRVFEAYIDNTETPLPFSIFKIKDENVNKRNVAQAWLELDKGIYNNADPGDKANVTNWCTGQATAIISIEWTGGAGGMSFGELSLDPPPQKP